MKLLVALGMISSFLIVEKVKVWKEKNGIVVVEAEHVQNRNALPPYWELAREVSGYEGLAFVQWKGASYVREVYEDVNRGRILTYYVSIEKEGNYYIKTKGFCLDEEQAELIVRINGGEWKKFVIPNDGNVNWDINSLQDSYPIFFPFGYHKVEIASVSEGFLFDRFILVHGSLAETAGDENFAVPYSSKKESRNEYVEDENFPIR